MAPFHMESKSRTELSLMVSITMAPSNGNIFYVTGPLWGESTGNRWIPLTQASDAELWCFLWSAPEQTVEQTIKMSVIWDAIALIIILIYYYYDYDVPVMIVAFGDLRQWARPSAATVVK